MNTVGARLRVLRASQGNPPQGAVAEAVGCSVRSYNGWEGDRARPSYESAKALGRYFDASPEWILYGAERSDQERLAAIEGKLDELLTLLRPKPRKS